MGAELDVASSELATVLPPTDRPTDEKVQFTLDQCKPFYCTTNTKHRTDFNNLIFSLPTY
jgi:hypothetical protein